MELKKFDISYAGCKEERSTRRARHGQIWTSDELKTLANLFAMGATLKNIAVSMERPADGVINKLSYMSLISHDSGYFDYVVTSKGQALQDAYARHNPTLKQPKEEIMESKAPTSAAPVIETKIFVQGEDATYLSDEQIFSRIAKLESKVDDLKKIRNRPKKLQAQIDTLETDILKLVEYVDTRS